MKLIIEIDEITKMAADEDVLIGELTWQMEVKNAIKNGTPIQPCEDCISRQAVLDEIGRREVKTFEAYEDYSKLYDFVYILPSVTPAEKVGHWIFRFRNGFGRALYKCSECDFDYDATGYNYCPNCGAKMQEVKE